VLSLAAIPWAGAHRSPGSPALRLDGEVLDYAALDRACSGVAAVLRRRGVNAGDRVALYCGNSLVAPAALYGALRLAAVAVPVSTASPPAELAGLLRRLRARLVVTDPEHATACAQGLRLAATGAARLVLDGDAESARGRVALAALVEHPRTDPVPVPAGHPAVVLLTSGTTGTPRLAVHSHAGLLLNARSVAGEMLGLDDGDIQLGALPLAHSFAISAVLNASLLAGASVVVTRHFDAAAALELIDGERVSVVQGVPTMLVRLAAAARRRPPSLRLCVVSGAPLPEGAATPLLQRLCATTLERYGMTEVSPLTVRRIPPGGGEPGDVGRPLSGVVVRTVGGAAEGELEAASPTMFLGYQGDRSATAAALRDGFFRTGDVGRVGADGRVHLSGRAKDVIVRGGNNVAAREVERVLEAHPDVVEAAVVGVPDADLGEEVAAAVVVRRGGERVLDELSHRCTEQLAAYKRPRRWLLVASLPRTVSGKVLKDEVRRALS